MKKNCTLLIFFMLNVALFFCGCSSTKESKKLDSRISDELEHYEWEYSSPETSYESTYDSDYWNYIDDKYEQMYYEAAVNANFTDDIQKHIYLFYGDEENEYSYTDALKANWFASLDHPEIDMMEMQFDVDYGSSDDQYIYQSLSYYSYGYDEYKKKLKEVNDEIKELVDAVNNTGNVVEKHRLIFKWITSNVRGYPRFEELCTVEFYDDEFILAWMKNRSKWNIYSAIVKKESGCEGIAKAYKYICNQCNLECIIVDGYIFGKKHYVWNLVKVYDSWYLVDATWNICKDYADYFMVKDFAKGERIPFNIGYTLPGYEETSSQMKLVELNKTMITTDTGIIFELLNENYAIIKYYDAIYTQLSSLGVERYIEHQEFSKDIGFKTNAEITRIDYFDYKGSLIKSVEIQDESIFSFPENIDETYVDSLNVYLMFEGNDYKVKIGKMGS